MILETLKNYESFCIDTKFFRLEVDNFSGFITTVKIRNIKRTPNYPKVIFSEKTINKSVSELDSV